MFDLLCTVGTAIICAALLAGLLGKRRKDEEEEEEEGAQAEAMERSAAPVVPPAPEGEEANAEGEEEEDEAQIKRRDALRVASLVPAIAAIVALILTQDFSQPMAIFDQWSLMFAIIAIVQIADAILSHKKKEEPEEEEGEGDDPTEATPAPATA